MDDKQDEDIPDWKHLIRSREGWRKVANRYVMEWDMVWKDVTIGFTVAGIIAAFVPQSFFEALFVGSGSDEPLFWEVFLQTLVGPIAAFFTFIGSMGNIPLAAILFANGVSFAGIMAFIFSDLVVFPVLRIQARYYGWKMALYILAIFLTALTCTALILHYGFVAFDLLPDPAIAKNVVNRQFFKIDYTLFLNILFATVSAAFVGWRLKLDKPLSMKSDRTDEKVLHVLAMLAFVWLIGGLGVSILV